MKKESRVYLRALELDDYKTSIKCEMMIPFGVS